MTRTKTCSWCKTEFVTSNKTTRCCSQHCALKFFHSRNCNAWLPEHDEWLRANRPRYTVAALTVAYNQEAEAQGWPPRTANAIALHLSLSNICTRARCHPVTNLDLGITYPSVAAAAHAMSVRPYAILSAIQRNGLCKGHRWAYADEVKQA